MSSTKNTPKCRCCDKDDVRHLGSKQGNHINQEFHYYKCNYCGYLFVDPFAGYHIYDDTYYTGKGPDPYVNYSSEYLDYSAQGRHHELADLYNIASRYVSESKHQGTVSWLDYGCGAGSLLRFLRKKDTLQFKDKQWGMELTGHDLGAWADRLASKDGFRILDLDQVGNEPANRYDIISMIEVVEHIEYPMPVFELASRLLKPGGLLLLTTGNLDSPIARRNGINYRYCIPEIHVGMFNPTCLNYVYSMVGLQPKHFKFNGVLHFKTTKSIQSKVIRRIANLTLRIPGPIQLIDTLYGVSAMPCAIKAAL